MTAAPAAVVLRSGGSERGEPPVGSDKILLSAWLSLLLAFKPRG